MPPDAKTDANSWSTLRKCHSANIPNGTPVNSAATAAVAAAALPHKFKHTGIERQVKAAIPQESLGLGGNGSPKFSSPMSSRSFSSVAHLALPRNVSRKADPPPMRQRSGLQSGV